MKLSQTKVIRETSRITESWIVSKLVVSKQLSCPTQLNLSSGDNFDLLFTVRPRLNATEPMEAGIHAARSFTGYGQERGGVQLVVTNPSWTTSAEIVYMESLPWFMRPYMHTLNSVVSSLDATSDARPSRFEKMFYRPALDRHRGTHLELQLSVPPRSKLTVTYFFDKAILRYTEYPPDANRGFDVAPAVIRLLDSKGDPKPKFIRTTSLLLPLPTPDFSMPYNVIILTSTVMALGFGSVFNLIVRRFVAADEVEKKSLSTLRRAVELTTKLVLGSFTRKSAKTD